MKEITLNDLYLEPDISLSEMLGYKRDINPTGPYGRDFNPQPLKIIPNSGDEPLNEVDNSKNNN